MSGASCRFSSRLVAGLARAARFLPLMLFFGCLLTGAGIARPAMADDLVSLKGPWPKVGPTTGGTNLGIIVYGDVSRVVSVELGEVTISKGISFGSYGEANYISGVLKRLLERSREVFRFTSP
nr:hypothetical protein [uncultured Gellertiella sp.]